jgi:hypothetical protein
MIYSCHRSAKEGAVSMQNPHFSALQAKHSGLDARIALETHRPAPDNALIATLKKQKLRIKEALARL